MSDEFAVSQVIGVVLLVGLILIMFAVGFTLLYGGIIQDSTPEEEFTTVSFSEDDDSIHISPSEFGEDVKLVVGDEEFIINESDVGGVTIQKSEYNLEQGDELNVYSKDGSQLLQSYSIQSQSVEVNVEYKRVNPHYAVVTLNHKNNDSLQGELEVNIEGAEWDELDVEETETVETINPLEYEEQYNADCDEQTRWGWGTGTYDCTWTTTNKLEDLTTIVEQINTESSTVTRQWAFNPSQRFVDITASMSGGSDSVRADVVNMDTISWKKTHDKLSPESQKEWALSLGEYSTYNAEDDLAFDWDTSSYLTESTSDESRNSLTAGTPNERISYQDISVTVTDTETGETRTLTDQVIIADGKILNLAVSTAHRRGYEDGFHIEGGMAGTSHSKTSVLYEAPNDIGRTTIDAYASVYRSCTGWDCSAYTYIFLDKSSGGSIGILSVSPLEYNSGDGSGYKTVNLEKGDRIILSGYTGTLADTSHYGSIITGTRGVVRDVTVYAPDQTFNYDEIATYETKREKIVQPPGKLYYHGDISTNPERRIGKLSTGKYTTISLQGGGPFSINADGSGAYDPEGDTLELTIGGKTFNYEIQYGTFQGYYVDLPNDIFKCRDSDYSVGGGMGATLSRQEGRWGIDQGFDNIRLQVFGDHVVDVRYDRVVVDCEFLQS